MAGVENGKHPILIAEDSQVMHLWFESQMEQLGLEYELVADGREAVERFETGKYALILMDCQMPVMDGLTATRMIREREKISGGHIPIIAMTAGVFPGEREACRQAGVDDLLMKPVKLEEMKTLLDRWLRGEKSEDMRLDVKEASASQAESAVSMERLQELIGEDEKLRQLVLSDYRKNSHQLMAEIEQAALAGDWELLQRAAHRFRPINDLLGANTMVALLKDLEEYAKIKDSRQIRSILPRLLSEYDRVLAALKNTAF